MIYGVGMDGGISIEGTADARQLSKSLCLAEAGSLEQCKTDLAAHEVPRCCLRRGFIIIIIRRNESEGESIRGNNI